MIFNPLLNGARNNLLILITSKRNWSLLIVLEKFYVFYIIMANTGPQKIDLFHFLRLIYSTDGTIILNQLL